MNELSRPPAMSFMNGFLIPPSALAALLLKKLSIDRCVEFHNCADIDKSSNNIYQLN
jgi:hypothetical protein